MRTYHAKLLRQEELIRLHIFLLRKICKHISARAPSLRSLSVLETGGARGDVALAAACKSRPRPRALYSAGRQNEACRTCWRLTPRPPAAAGRSRRTRHRRTVQTTLTPLALTARALPGAMASRVSLPGNNGRPNAAGCYRRCGRMAPVPCYGDAARHESPRAPRLRSGPLFSRLQGPPEVIYGLFPPIVGSGSSYRWD
jgi:hypothetical protein